MRRTLSLLVLTIGVATAQSATPALLNGIWKLTGLSGSGTRDGQLVISGASVRGSYGCSPFDGQIQAGRSQVRISARVVEAASGTPCRFGGRGALVRGLNSARSYILNRDHLILFSKGVRLAFERVGFVTPVKPRP